jgi:hypothetical protein
MKTQKINLFNVGFPGFATTEADRRDGTVGHVNYALSQIDLATGIDTDYNARGRVLFNVITGTNPSRLGSGSTLTIGEKYLIDYLVDGDDFTNVGAAENAVGVVFIATGETPAVWNESTLVQNAANFIAQFMDKFKGQKNLKWALYSEQYFVNPKEEALWQFDQNNPREATVAPDGEVTLVSEEVGISKDVNPLSYNKGFEYIGGPSVFTENATMFDYVYASEEVVLENVEYFYGSLYLINFDCKIYDTTFPNLEFSFIESENGAFLVIKDDSVDFRNYTVWSSAIAASVYRSVNTGEIKYPIGSTGRVTAVSDAAYLSEFVDSEDGKIYIPIFEPKLGLRFDFEIRLYDYVAPVPVIDVDIQALEKEYKRIEMLLKEVSETEGNESLVAAYKQQLEDLKALIEFYRKDSVAEEAANF